MTGIWMKWKNWFQMLESDFSTSVSLVVIVEKSGSEKSPRAPQGEHATGL